MTSVKQFMDLKRNRGPATAVAVQGLWALHHALSAGVVVEAVFACDDLLRGSDSESALREAQARGAKVVRVSERVLRRMVDRDGPDGLAAIAHLRRWSLRDIDLGPSARLVVLDRMELAGNLGAVIRCADGAGASAVALTDRRIRVTHPLVVKASMGTLFSMPILDASVEELQRWGRARGVRFVAADPAAQASYRDGDYGGPVALVLGSERYGLSSEWRAAADQLVSIPMLGVADSLNVGHAAALLLYESLTAQTTGRRFWSDRRL